MLVLSNSKSTKQDGEVGRVKCHGPPRAREGTGDRGTVAHRERQSTTG